MPAPPAHIGSEKKTLQNPLRLPAAVFAYLFAHVCHGSVSRVFVLHSTGVRGHCSRTRRGGAHGEEVAMIVMSGSLRTYGVPARSGKSAGKVCALRHPAGTIRYNGYSTSGWRSRRRSSFSQIVRRRGRLMQASLRIVKEHSRVTGAARGLRGRVDSAHVTCAGATCLSRSLSCLALSLCAWIGLVCVGRR